jgi:hypothetical protein
VQVAAIGIERPERALRVDHDANDVLLRFEPPRLRVPEARGEDRGADERARNVGRRAADLLGQ